MKSKKLLAIFLLGIGLCFMPLLRNGMIGQCEERSKAYLSPEEVHSLLVNTGLLKARIDYIMRNPTDFLNVDFYYDQEGMFTKEGLFPEGVDTEGKIVVIVADNRGVFSNKSGTVLLNEFKEQLETILHSSAILEIMVPIPEIMKRELRGEMDTNIVARFCTKWEISPPSPLPEEVCLGYFYQGEYHLWEK